MKMINQMISEIARIEKISGGAVDDSTILRQS